MQMKYRSQTIVSWFHGDWILLSTRFACSVGTNRIVSLDSTFIMWKLETRIIHNVSVLNWMRLDLRRLISLLTSIITSPLPLFMSSLPLGASSGVFQQIFVAQSEQPSALISRDGAEQQVQMKNIPSSKAQIQSVLY